MFKGRVCTLDLIAEYYVVNPDVTATILLIYLKTDHFFGLLEPLNLHTKKGCG